MILGMDCSTQLEVDAKNPHYYYKGKEVEPWTFLKEHNDVSSMRLRIWLDPYDEDGHPYGGGTNDYPAFVKLAKRAMASGFSILLDFHYSDFWCDPGKQLLPKAWRGLNVSQVAEKVYEYTKKTLSDLKKEGIAIEAIQIGNEITNGTLWPLGKLNKVKEGEPREGYDNLVAFLKSGVKAAREEMPKAKLVIHLENSGNLPLHQEFFDEVTKRGLDFDIIGLSYYPYWHGTFEMLFANVENLKARYKKPIWIVETGYGFTMEPFVSGPGFVENLINEDFFSQSEVKTYRPYPLTKEGQRDFVKNLIRLSKEHDIKAIYYWEPLWLPLPGLEWASKYGEAYTNELNKPTHTEWANQCLFDYEGEATPALEEYRVK